MDIAPEVPSGSQPVAFLLCGATGHQPAMQLPIWALRALGLPKRPRYSRTPLATHRLSSQYDYKVPVLFHSRKNSKEYNSIVQYKINTDILQLLVLLNQDVKSSNWHIANFLQKWVYLKNVLVAWIFKKSFNKHLFAMRLLFRSEIPAENTLRIAALVSFLFRWQEFGTLFPSGFWGKW